MIVQSAEDECARVAILSDTHGTLDDRIADLVTTCDLAIHGGDIGEAGVLAQLQPRWGRVLAVRGNNDVAETWPERDRELLDEIPDWLAVDLPGGRLMVTHGHQGPARDRHARLRRRFASARAIVYGHSHRLVLDRDALPWVLNPGAAGRARTYGGPSCLILTARQTDWDVQIHRFTLTSRRAG